MGGITVPSKVICPTTHRDLKTNSWKQSGLCFQQSPLDLYRFHPHQSLSPKGPPSCENSVPLTLTSSSQETQSITAGMWAGARLRAAGQPRGIYNGEPGPGRGHLRLHHPARPQLPCLGTQHPPHSLAKGTKAAYAGEGATEPRSRRAEGPGGGVELGVGSREGPS